MARSTEDCCLIVWQSIPQLKNDFLVALGKLGCIVQEALLLNFTKNCILLRYTLRVLPVSCLLRSFGTQNLSQMSLPLRLARQARSVPAGSKVVTMAWTCLTWRLLIRMGTALNMHQVSVQSRQEVVTHPSVRILGQVDVTPLGMLARWDGIFIIALNKAADVIDVCIYCSW